MFVFFGISQSSSCSRMKAEQCGVETEKDVNLLLLITLGSRGYFFSLISILMVNEARSAERKK